jgi:hypothetical protein
MAGKYQELGTLQGETDKKPDLVYLRWTITYRDATEKRENYTPKSKNVMPQGRETEECSTSRD